MQDMIRQRLINIREKNRLSQEDFSKIMGMNNRQSLQELEAGRRNIQPSEIVKASDYFKVDISYFTDPYEIAGEARFSWRKSSESNEKIETFESKAAKWIAAYRHLTKLQDKAINSSLPQVSLNIKSTQDDAALQGEYVSKALELGDVPAKRLSSILESKLDILVLYADTISTISGAACQLGALNTVIINRNETEGRRNFDLAHELFHLMTWHEMPPQHVEVNQSELKGKDKKIERLADSFAGGLLMPTKNILKYITIKTYPRSTEDRASWILEAAENFRVSGVAMKVRLDVLGYKVEDIQNHQIRLNYSQEQKPLIFNRNFVETFSWGIDSGNLSIRKAANILNLTIDALAGMFAEHSLKAPFDI